MRSLLFSSGVKPVLEVFGRALATEGGNWFVSKVREMFLDMGNPAEQLQTPRQLLAAVSALRSALSESRSEVRSLLERVARLEDE